MQISFGIAVVAWWLVKLLTGRRIKAGGSYWEEARSMFRDCQQQGIPLYPYLLQ